MKFVVILLAYLTQDISGLKLLRVLVPPLAVRGETALLHCQYDLEGDSLYSVKWYKDNEEFFRFVPKANPPLHSYRLEGVKVDHHKSDSRKVSLRAVTLKTSGVYRCEVSAEAPSFASVQGEGIINVVYMPVDGPHITGEQNQYEIGDDINLNCTSGRSHPASVLQWFINSKQVTDPVLLVPYPAIVHPSGLVTTSLGLRLRVDSGHFIGGSMRVRCVANVAEVTREWGKHDDTRNSELARVGAEWNGNGIGDGREALLLVRSSSSRHSSMWSTIIIIKLLLLIL